MARELVLSRPGAWLALLLALALDGSTGGIAATPEPTSPARTVLFWTDPMVPGSRFDHGGKSPFMDMELVPVYGNDPDIVAVTPRQGELIGLETQAVEPRPLAAAIRTEGDITYDERNIHDVTIRVNARVSKYFPFHEGLIVEKGRPLFEVASPEIYTYISDYIGLQRNAGLINAVSMDRTHVVQQSLTTLMWRGIPKETLDEAMRTGKASDRMTIRAPVTGMVLKRLAVEGSLINAGVKTGQFTTYGTTVATIADISFVYAEAKLYEHQIDRVKPGMLAEVAPQGSAGERLVAKVTYVYPTLKAGKRFGIARIAIANPEYHLKPGMYAKIRILPAADGEGALAVPYGAVVDTGEARFVYVQVDATHFQRREVKTGPPTSGWCAVESGLARGEKVAVGGVFFLDAARVGAGAS